MNREELADKLRLNSWKSETPWSALPPGVQEHWLEQADFVLTFILPRDQRIEELEAIHTRDTNRCLALLGQTEQQRKCIEELEARNKELEGQILDYAAENEEYDVRNKELEAEVVGLKHLLLGMHNHLENIGRDVLLNNWADEIEIALSTPTAEKVGKRLGAVERLADLVRDELNNNTPHHPELLEKALAEYEEVSNG